jgi:hypothetical protein
MTDQRTTTTEAPRPMTQVEALGITVDLAAKRAALEEIQRLLPFFETKPGIEEAITDRLAEIEENFPPDELTV